MHCIFYFDVSLIFISRILLALVVLGSWKRVVSETLSITLCILIVAFLLGGILYNPKWATIPIKSLEFGNCKCEFDTSRPTYIPLEGFSCEDLKQLKSFFPKGAWQDTLCMAFQDTDFKNNLILLNCRQGDDFFIALQRWHEKAIDKLDITKEQKEEVIKILIEDLIVIEAARQAICTCSSTKCLSRDKQSGSD